MYFRIFCLSLGGMTSLVAQTVKCLSTTRETQVRSLGQEDPLEKEMAIHSSTIAWKIPWTEEFGRLQSMGLQSRTRLSDFTNYVFKILSSHLRISYVSSINKITYTWFLQGDSPAFSFLRSPPFLTFYHSQLFYGLCCYCEQDSLFHCILIGHCWPLTILYMAICLLLINS